MLVIASKRSAKANSLPNKGIAIPFQSVRITTCRPSIRGGRPPGRRDV